MSTSSLILRRSYYWSHYLVVRWQLILTIFILWFSGNWLRTHYGEEDSTLWMVMRQFLILARWTVIGLFAVSLLTALMSWLFFLFQARKNKVKIKIQLGDGHQAIAGWVPLSVVMTGKVIRPLLGTIRVQLVFAGKEWSEVITLDANVSKRGELRRQGIKGYGATMLHDRGIYDVEKVHVRFCDMFSLIALPYTLPMTQQLFTLPKELERSTVKAQPNTTEQQTHRVEIPRRVEGEFINYKEFETGDNIRRIVWKIYAKSGELVVRIPETRDPYASHLYFYASYYSGMDPGIFEAELLNVYKDKVRNLYEAIQKNGYDVRIPQDQEVPKLPGMSDKHIELFQITAANWQTQNPPAAFVQPSKAAFVCISALVPVSELEPLLNNLSPTVPVVVVKLSDAIPSPFRIKIKDLFFSPEKKPEDKLRNPWLLAPLRSRLKKNEDEILKVLNQRGNGWIVKAIEMV